jgi:wyosine [tRNA(Phe)-imidazoG37] synthetase (radical SAM superfamily)
VITITSNGEPTLYPYLDKLVDELNKIKMDKKLLILSNGSTICDKNIKSTFEKLDFVKLSLDCATSKCFKKIDRPLKDIELDKIISCMKDIKTTLIIEILLVQGINDKASEIEAINQVLQEIKPDRVDIGTIDRPPAYDVKRVEEDKLVELSKLIKNIPVSVIRKNPPSQKQDFTKEELLNLLSHRPQSQFDVDTFFSKSAKKVLDELYHNEKVMKKDIAGTIFYTKA